MSHHRTRKRRTATAVVTLVSCLSLFAVAAQAQSNAGQPKPGARQARGAGASLQGDQPEPRELDEIANKIRKIESNFVERGRPGFNAEQHISLMREAENPLEVANPLLADIRKRLVEYGGRDIPFTEIRAEDSRTNFASINTQLDRYISALSTLPRATQTPVQTPSPGATDEGWGDSLSWLGQVALAALSLLGLGLGAAALLLFLRMRENLAQLRHDVRKVATAVSKTPLPAASAQTPTPQAPTPPASSDGTNEQLSRQVREQQQALALLTQQIGTLENRAAAGEKRTTDSLQAVEQVTRWLTRMHMRGAEADVFDDENERANALATLERYNERLRSNALIVEPLTQAIAELMETLEARPNVSPELLARVQRLYHEIGQFDQWAVTSEAQLGALRRGSMDERRVKFQSEQRQLGEQLKANRITFAQYIDQFSRLLEHHFPPGSADGGAAQSAVAQLSDEQLRQYVDGAPEYLMDWFSSFSQLQSQAQAALATGGGVDSETVEALASVQRVGRDVLSRFDIQPEEIFVGRTNYDRHLHEAAMIRQTTQFPVNTVIEVHRAGFRRVSTGEVLRRPQVIVAGAGA